VSDKERKSAKNEQYLDIEQLYQLAAQSGNNININMISNSEVVIQSNQHLAIRIDTVIQNIETLNLSTKTKNQILQTVSEIKQQAESKAPWEEIIGKIMLLLSFGKEALPIVADLLKWLTDVMQ
jgi:hypothetical protein